MKTNQNLQLFPDDIWLTILTYTVSDKASYATATSTSQQISTLVQNNLALWNPEIALGLVKAHPKKFNTLPSKLKNNSEFVLRALSKTALPWSSVFHLHTNKEWPNIIKYTVAAAAFFKPKILNNPPAKLVASKVNKALILATKERIKRLKHKNETDEDLNQCSEIEMRHICPDAMRKHARLRIGVTNKIFMMHLLKLPLTYHEAVFGSPWLNLAPPELQTDKQIVLPAVQTDGRALRYANSKLQDDKEVVLQAVESNPNAIEFASLRLKKDKDIILTAVTKARETDFPTMDFLQFADQSVLNDVAFAMQLLETSGKVYLHLSPDMQKNRDIILHVLQHLPNLEIGFAICSRQPNDREIVTAVITQYPSLVHVISEELKCDLFFILELIAKNGNVFHYISSDLQNDPMIALEFLNN